MAIVAPPPNSTGDPGRDIQALAEWTWDLYQGFLAGGGFTTTNETADLETSLQGEIDPAAATAATAQALANANKAVLDAQDTGVFTISETDTTVVVPLTNDQADTDYAIVASVTAISGTPATNAHIMKGVTKTTTQFTAEILAAPGAGDSITYNWILMRND